MTPSTRLEPTLLLPLSYAISRPLLTATLAVDFTLGLLPLLLLGALSCRFADGVVRSVAYTPGDEQPDALLWALSLLLQLAAAVVVVVVAMVVVVDWTCR